MSQAMARVWGAKTALLHLLSKSRGSLALSKGAKAGAVEGRAGGSTTKGAGGAGPSKAEAGGAGCTEAEGRGALPKGRAALH